MEGDFNDRTRAECYVAVGGVNGFDTAGNASALYAMVVAIRSALVANGIMS